jgi:UDP-glucose 4-epimerase
MKILTTGGAGYIGSHTVRALLDAGEDVTVIDNLDTGFRAAVPKDARFFEGDVRDRDFLDRVFAEARFDGVIHFAASSRVGESVENPLKYYDNNLCGMICLLEAMRKRSVPTIVFSSTAAVYGLPKRFPISEDDETAPINPYGESKLMMERMMASCDRAHGVRYAALRYFNAAGAHPGGDIGEAHDPETHLIPVILHTATGRRRNLTIFGNDYPTADGSCVRDYIHVCDLADAHIRAFRYLSDGGKSEVFNLGNGAGFSNFEVLKACERAVGAAVPYEIGPRRAGDPDSLVASGEKARRILGWEPACPDLDGIIASAWTWHSAHPEGYAT